MKKYFDTYAKNDKFHIIRGRHGSALIMIVLMFAILLVLGTGAGMMASISSRSAIKETKNEQAFIAARSVALAIKDEIVNSTQAEVTAEKLLKASDLSSDYLLGTDYQLTVASTDIGSGIKEHTFTVKATYEGATEQYSFKLHESSSFAPDTSPVTDMFYLASWQSGNADVVIPADVTVLDGYTFKGDFSGKRLRSGGDLIVQTGQNVTNGTIVALGSVEVKNVNSISGDVYARGNITINDDITGNLFTEGNVIVNSKVTGNIYAKGTVTTNAVVAGSIVQNATAMPVEYTYQIEDLEDAVLMLGENGGMVTMSFEDLPKPFTYDPDLLNLAMNSGGLTAANSSTSGNTVTITDHASINSDSFNKKTSKLVIDATSADPDKVIYVYVNKNSAINFDIESKGHVMFVLKEGITFDLKDSNFYSSSSVLGTYIYGLNNNELLFAGGGNSLHAYIYIEGNSGSLDLGNKTDQLIGFAQVAELKIKNTITNIVFNSPSTSDDSDDDAEQSTFFKYVGVSD